MLGSTELPCSAAIVVTVIPKLVYLSNKVSDWTKEYHSAGMRLFSCGNSKNPKLPMSRGWVNVPFYKDGVSSDDFYPVYGVSLDPWDFVLDYDPRSDKTEGKTELADLLDLFGLTENCTFTVVTPRGGVHMYFKKPEGVDETLPLRFRVPGYGSIECKSKGRFVVGCGSMYPEDLPKALIKKESGVYPGAMYKPYPNCPPLTRCIQVPVELFNLCTREEHAHSDIEFDEEEDDEGAVRRFIMYCQTTDPAVEGEGGDNRTFQVACEGREYGLSARMTLDIMTDYFNERCQPEWDGNNLALKVKHAFAYAGGPKGGSHPSVDFAELDAITEDGPEDGGVSQTVYSKPGGAADRRESWDKCKRTKEFKSSLHNTMNYLLWPTVDEKPNPLCGLLRYNEFAYRIEFTKHAPWHKQSAPIPPWDDMQETHLAAYLASSVSRPLEPSGVVLYRSVCAAAASNSYHPIKDFFAALPQWDGVPRIDSLLIEFGGAPDTPYTREVTKNFLIAAVARIFEPGCKFDNMIILEGPQGYFKSSFIAVLGGEWFSEIRIVPDNKDTYMAMHGYWFLELPDMRGMRRNTEVDALKAFLAIGTDNLRLPYARGMSSVKRQSIFASTYNPVGGGYLQDPSGNRRFWPVEISKRIDVDSIRELRPMIFAEALHRYKQGEKFYIADESLRKEAEEEQEKRYEVDPWEEVLQDWLSTAETLPFPLKTVDIAMHSPLKLMVSDLDKLVRNRLAVCMRRCGYELKPVRQPGLRIKQWVQIEDEPLDL